MIINKCWRVQTTFETGPTTEVSNLALSQLLFYLFFVFYLSQLLRRDCSLVRQTFVTFLHEEASH